MVAFADFHRRSIEDRDAFWSEQSKLIDWATSQGATKQAFGEVLRSFSARHGAEVTVR